jgi:hypothetical protein
MEKVKYTMVCEIWTLEEIRVKLNYPSDVRMSIEDGKFVAEYADNALINEAVNEPVEKADERIYSVFIPEGGIKSGCALHVIKAIRELSKSPAYAECGGGYIDLKVCKEMVDMVVMVVKEGRLVYVFSNVTKKFAVFAKNVLCGAGARAYVQARVS